MTIFDWFDNLVGFNIFNHHHGRKHTSVVEKVPELEAYAETPVKVIVDETAIFIWLQKQIEWETGLRLNFVLSKVDKEFPELGFVSIKDLSLTDDIGMDSLELTELLVESEVHFNMKIMDESAVKVRTVGDALNLICTTLQETQISK